ncbi:conserved hypothetical protein [Xenorhabdus bovienii str. kraussei Becker Underwood]|uniref:Uncharacterized protein n=1 Tax=Xenorhabdus bovienii str. kraussei Becker Underwood TaxID=1398204 RepID=A0A077PW76_XENBV|nr:conserved hypothetical protein [Xenorhabdus bovienii str. kraussei Becker Underwood]
MRVQVFVTMASRAEIISFLDEITLHTKSFLFIFFASKNVTAGVNI